MFRVEPSRRPVPPPTCALLASLLLVCAAPRSLHAGQAVPDPIPFERGMELLRLELLAAESGLCALGVAAHPDDEDGATLAWLRRIAGVEIHSCLATRGEGGQNESGPELGPELAALRTRETEEAARILGAKVWYLNQPDFGFSKSSAEALDPKIGRWDRNTALERLVRIIRIVQPEIVLTRHDPQGTDHGHHRATAQLLEEALAAAASPARFPDQLAKDRLGTWKTAKYYRTQTGGEKPDLELDLTVRDPLSDRCPAELAAWALTCHRSQGMAPSFLPGTREVRPLLLLQPRLQHPQPEHSPLQGLPALPEPCQDLHSDLFASLEQAAGPGRARPGSWAWVREALGETPAVLAERILLAHEATRLQLLRAAAPGSAPGAWNAARLQRRLRHLAAAATIALGIRIESRPQDLLLANGEQTGLEIRITNSGPLAVVLDQLRLSGEAGWSWTPPTLAKQALPTGAFLEDRLRLSADESACPTWPRARYLFERIESRAPLALQASLHALVGDREVAFQTPRQEAGPELARPLELELAPNPALLFVDPDQGERELVLCTGRLLATNHLRAPAKVYARLAPDERIPARREQELVFAFEGEEQRLSAEFRFMASLKLLNDPGFQARFQLWTREFRLPEEPALRFTPVPLRLEGPLQVGLVKTYDDATEAALRLLAQRFTGVQVTLLDPETLRSARLGNFHSILLDLRATQYRPDLLQQRERLRAFMQEGGNLVCMYHKDFDWNAEDQEARGRGLFRGHGGGGQLAPYPITLSFKRITDETAPVRLLDARHPLLCRPCKIWEGDFAGWVQERGVYFPASWHENYRALLSCADPGEEALEGGLLVAEVGKGSFIYTSLVWYRQLRAGNPGAFRMLANLISYPRTKDGAK